MKKFLLSIIVLIAFSTLTISQNTVEQLLNTPLPELYVEVMLPTKDAVNKIAADFSVDKVQYNPVTNDYKVKIWLGKRDFQPFVELGISFSICDEINNAKWNAAVATTYSQMVANWNRYPSYSAYLAIMDTFQTRYPDICKIDTILASTPNNHKILVANITQNPGTQSDKPAFFYTSTMHGDEVGGYYMMIRLIDYILTNQSDAKIQNILNNVDLWICPLENPDGTYYYSDNTIGTPPISIRANANNYDLNRSFPLVNITNRSYQPEVQAMMDFAAARSFVMSANLHGGAEVFNYPWDCCTTNECAHPDNNWFWYVGRAFADTCHTVNPNYFTDLNNGVTEGGDWYIVTGSRQDYMNYYHHCREITLEVSGDKILSNNSLNAHWGYIRKSLLNYIEEILYGFRGIVTDSLSGEPLYAKVLINNHDQEHNNTEVYSKLPLGNYHRPVKGGSYSVTFSADGYLPKTIQIVTTDRNVVIHNVELVKKVSVDEYAQTQLSLYPNPTDDFIIINTDDLNLQDLRVEILDMNGKLIEIVRLTSGDNKISMRQFPKGIYLLKLMDANGEIKNGKVIRK